MMMCIDLVSMALPLDTSDMVYFPGMTYTPAVGLPPPRPPNPPPPPPHGFEAMYPGSACGGNAGALPPPAPPRPPRPPGKFVPGAAPPVDATGSVRSSQQIC